jgi:drug/metabolite transporter (DMT)-like permease
VRRLWLIVMLLAATAVWGWTFVVVKEAVAGYGVVAFLALRFGIGSALLAALAFRQLSWRTLLAGGGIGLALAVGYYFQTAGIRYTTVTNSGFITSLFVVTTPLINRLLFGVKIRPIFWGAVAVTLLGLYLLTAAAPVKPRTEQTAPPPLAAQSRSPGMPFTAGDFLTLGAAIFYGLHIALLDRFAKRHPPLALAFAQTASTSLLFFLIWPLTTEPLAWPSAPVWAALAITGVLATAAGFAVQTYVQQRLPAITSTLIFSTEPVFATLFGCILLREQLGGVQIVGITLMIGAIVAAQLGAGEHASTYPLDPL